VIPHVTPHAVACFTGARVSHAAALEAVEVRVTEVRRELGEQVAQLAQVVAAKMGALAVAQQAGSAVGVQPPPAVE
jgi:hypothetical protein